MPTLDCLHKHIFLLDVYRSVFLARMRRYKQLTYLFHQCATSLLSRDGRIVRHPGVERPFSSLLRIMNVPLEFCVIDFGRVQRALCGIIEVHICWFWKESKGSFQIVLELFLSTLYRQQQQKLSN